jgi:hypothetical protein
MRYWMQDQHTAERRRALEHDERNRRQLEAYRMRELLHELQYGRTKR